MFANDQDRALLLKVHCMLAGVVVLGLVAGTFVDLGLSQALYVKEQPLGQLISVLGIFPLAIPLCMLFGAIIQRFSRDNRPIVAKVILCVCLVAVALFSCYHMAKAFFTYDGIGPLLPFQMPTIGFVIIGAVTGGGLLLAGFKAAQRNDEADLLRRAVTVTVLLLASFLLVELVKNLMHRPRYRTLMLGYEGIDFTAWYKPFHGASELMDKYELADDAFKSFPSGHSNQAAITAMGFYGLAVLFPKLRSHWKLAAVLLVVFVVLVLPVRIVLGAHFLSDVSVGALVSLAAGAYLFSRQD